MTAMTLYVMIALFGMVWYLERIAAHLKAIRSLLERAAGKG